MGRDLVELLPVDDAQLIQVLQRRGQHGVGDPGNSLFQLAKSAGLVLAQLVNDMGAPFAVQHFQRAAHGAAVADLGS